MVYLWTPRSWVKDQNDQISFIIFQICPFFSARSCHQNVWKFEVRTPYYLSIWRVKPSYVLKSSIVVMCSSKIEKTIPIFVKKGKCVKSYYSVSTLSFSKKIYTFWACLNIFGHHQQGRKCLATVNFSEIFWKLYDFNNTGSTICFGPLAPFSNTESIFLLLELSNDVYNLFLGQLVQNLQVNKVWNTKQAPENIHFTT